MNIAALLELQRVDTAIDQRVLALQRLPERRSHAEAASRLAHLRSQRDDLRREQSIQEAELADIERRSAAIDVQRARLEKQLKTVIAPREAEALQHELAVLAIQREELDDRGLALLESSSEADRDLARLAGEEVSAIAAEETARREMDVAIAAAEADLAAVREQRDIRATALDPSDLASYERLRTVHGGVAITVIENKMCAGCNMDLSVAELDAIRRRPADDIVECPNCNRLIAR